MNDQPAAGARVSRNIGTKEAREVWSEYLLEDGTKLRARALIHGVRRIEGKYAANGDPEYEWQFTVQTECIAPDELRKAPEQKAPDQARKMN